MVDDQTPASNSQYPISEAELHYKSLTDLFKFLVTVAAVFIGLFTTAGLYLGLQRYGCHARRREAESIGR